jgi:hypothetical protein
MGKSRIKRTMSRTQVNQLIAFLEKAAEDSLEALVIIYLRAKVSQRVKARAIKECKTLIQRLTQVIDMI